MTHLRIPIVSVVGKGDSGRTTLLEGLIAELTARGYRIATAKHHFHETDIDTPGKDTWRHWNAGAVVTMVSAPDRVGVFRRVDEERTLAELVEEAGDVDIMLTEGFRQTSPVLVEVVRAERSTEPICDPGELLALVTDVDELRDAPLPVFALDDVAGLADLVEERFLGGSGARGAVSGAGTEA